jgi:hypothetical protein
MGFLDGMLGNASKIDASKIQQEFSQVLAPGEQVEQATAAPIQKQFNKKLSIYEVQSVLASYVLR